MKETVENTGRHQSAEQQQNQKDVRILENIPAELKSRAQWVNWKKVNREGKDTKVPISPKNGGFAKTNDSATWSSFEDAVAFHLANREIAGIGFMFTSNDPFCGIDLDHVRNPMTGEIHPYAIKIIVMFPSYWEVSQSGTGVHGIIRGKLKGKGRRVPLQVPNEEGLPLEELYGGAPGIEIYDEGRYFVMTGDALEGQSPDIVERQVALDKVTEFFFNKEKLRKAPEPSPASTSTSDEKILSRALESDDDQFKALWQGDISGYGGDHSKADAALLSKLHYWSGGDKVACFRLFEQSGLCREKWTERPDYRERTWELVSNGETLREQPHGAATAGTLSDKDLMSYEASDLGNVLALKAVYPNRFCYSSEFGCQHFNGRYWDRENAECALKAAIIDLLDRRHKCAAEEHKKDKRKASLHESKVNPEKKQLADFCKPNAHRVNSTAEVAKSILTVPKSKFDSKRTLTQLPCENGVINLRTGEMSPHNPLNYMSFACPTIFDKDCDYSEWHDWLVTTTDEKTAAFLQLGVGYTITGLTNEEVLFYIAGPPRSGKGCFTETLMATFGRQMCRETSFDTFTTTKADSDNFHFAPMKDARIILASESRHFEQLNEAKLKAVTGGNEIQCCFKRQEHFTFRPKFKIWLSSNHDPNIDPDDDAAWYRLRLIPFPNSHVGKEDTSLKARFSSEDYRKKVLKWAVDGAVKYFQLHSEGRRLPDPFEEEKDNIRLQQDSIRQYLDARVVMDPGGVIGSTELYQDYADWCMQVGYRPKQHKAFTAAIKAKKIELGRNSKRAFFRGISFANDMNAAVAHILAERQ